MSDHEDFQGLAAGYALHALEPHDEQRLAAHLLTCPECARIVADAAAVGAAFAELIVAGEAPSASLRDRILAAAAAEPRKVTLTDLPAARVVLPDAEPTQSPARHVVSQERTAKARRFQVRSRILVGALAAVIGVGIAVPVTLSVSGGSKGVDPALADALFQPGAHLVSLSGDSRSSAAAQAVVSDKGALLVADRLPANNRSNSTYVLWMAGGTGEPVAVATFDVHSGSPVTVPVKALPMPASQIRHLAVSREAGRTAPATPTDIVIQGTAA